MYLACAERAYLSVYDPSIYTHLHVKYTKYPRDNRGEGGGGRALYELASRFNHACCGNATWVVMNGNILVYVVCGDVVVGGGDVCGGGVK